MAETRSKAAKKRNANLSFISNLAKNVKKGKFCSPIDSQGYLSGSNKLNPPTKSSRKTPDLNTQPVQSSKNKNAIHTSNTGDNVEDVDSLLEEDPIWLECSDEEIEMSNLSGEEKCEEKSSTTKERMNDAELFSKGSYIAEYQNISVSRKPKKSQITSSTDANQTKVEKSVTYGSDGIDSVILFGKSDKNKNEGCSSHHVEEMSDSNNPLDIDDLTSEKSSGSLAQNKNSESSGAKILFKGYGDLVKVVEELKHVNLLVKKIQEELKKCIK